MKHILIPIVVLLVIAGSAYYIAQKKGTPTPSMTSQEPSGDGEMMKKVVTPQMDQSADMTTESPDMMLKDETFSGNVVTPVTTGESMMTMGKYMISAGTPVGGAKNVLFFHATWCPTCKTADADITSRLNEIPSDMIIHKVDYDTSLVLKQKYGVTMQHTFVYVDDTGSPLSKWSGGGLTEILSHVI